MDSDVRKKGDNDMIAGEGGGNWSWCGWQKE